MMIEKNIYIIGPMGAGKSTVGQQLARALKRPFYDTDREVERQTGVDLSWIFDVEGEEGFRHREAATLQELVKLSGAVIATGGETVLKASNRELLKTTGHVIHLTTNLDQQFERTARNQYKRPSLRGDDSYERIINFSEERGHLYREIAEATFESNHRNVSQVVKELLKHIKKIGW